MLGVQTLLATVSPAATVVVKMVKSEADWPDVFLGVDVLHIAGPDCEDTAVVAYILDQFRQQRASPVKFSMLQYLQLRNRRPMPRVRGSSGASEAGRGIGASASAPSTEASMLDAVGRIKSALWRVEGDDDVVMISLPHVVLESGEVTTFTLPFTRQMIADLGAFSLCVPRQAGGLLTVATNALGQRIATCRPRLVVLAAGNSEWLGEALCRIHHLPLVVACSGSLSPGDAAALSSSLYAALYDVNGDMGAIVDSCLLTCDVKGARVIRGPTVEAPLSSLPPPLLPSAPLPVYAVDAGEAALVLRRVGTGAPVRASPTAPLHVAIPSQVTRASSLAALVRKSDTEVLFVPLVPSGVAPASSVSLYTLGAPRLCVCVVTVPGGGSQAVAILSSTAAGDNDAVASLFDADGPVGRELSLEVCGTGPSSRPSTILLKTAQAAPVPITLPVYSLATPPGHVRVAVSAIQAALQPPPPVPADSPEEEEAAPTPAKEAVPEGKPYWGLLLSLVVASAAVGMLATGRTTWKRQVSE